MRSGQHAGLRALTQLSFLHSAWLLLQLTGLWKHTLLIFVFSLFFPPPQPNDAEEMSGDHSHNEDQVMSKQTSR